MTKPHLKIFSWGYWGWGNATKQLVDAVNEVEEASGGFGPPLFIDIRIRRSGRAPGFRGRAFEDLLGSERYVWMQELGNKSVATGRGPRIQIADPSAANTLLDTAVNAAKQKRHVIFFCACKLPASCHRATVAQLVSEAAHKRGLRTEVIEWPGGDPIPTAVSVAEPIVGKVKRGAKSIPIQKSDIARFAGLPWYSCVAVNSNGHSINAFCGPAVYDLRAGWRLKVLELAEAKLSDSAKKREAADYRAVGGYVAVS